MPLGGKDDDYSASVTSFLKVLSSAGLIGASRHAVLLQLARW